MIRYNLCHSLYVSLNVCLCLCVRCRYVCVAVRVSACVTVCARVRVWLYVCVCVRACVRACVYACAFQSLSKCLMISTLFRPSCRPLLPPYFPPTHHSSPLSHSHRTQSIPGKNARFQVNVAFPGATPEARRTYQSESARVDPRSWSGREMNATVKWGGGFMCVETNIHHN